MPSKANPAVGAGGGGGRPPWTQRETGDLVSIWGEKVQQAGGGASRRKTLADAFQRIAEQMAARGHARSALECRAKIGALRVAYRRTFEHNTWQRFEAPRTCPFYPQLDRVLHGDGVDKPPTNWRSSSSLNICWVPKEPTPLPGNTGEATDSESPNKHGGQNAPTLPTRNEQEVVDDEVGAAQPPPASSLANTQTKRSVSGPHSEAERLVEQPSKLCEEKPRARGKRRKKEPEGRKEAGMTLRSRSITVKK